MDIEVTKRRWRLAQAAEIRWWKRYLSKKPVSEYLDWKKNYWLQFLDKFKISPFPEAKVLDAGCGPAGIFTALPQCQVTAVDPLLSEYQQIEHFKEANYPYVEWKNNTLENFQAEGVFDFIFCLNVINHVRDLEQVTQNLAKAAKSDAQLIISVDAHRHRWLKPIFRAIPGDILHPHQLDIDEYAELFERNGLRVIQKELHKEEFLFDYWVFLLCPN